MEEKDPDSLATKAYKEIVQGKKLEILGDC